MPGERAKRDRAPVVIAARLLALLGIVALYGGAIYVLLRALSWLIRRTFLYESAIRAFEAQPVPPGAILFTGSSTIRLWDSLARDFAPFPVVNRGFGGAVVSQVLHFAPRLLPSSPPLRAVVFYCGGNDLAWGVSIGAVLRDVEAFLRVAKERLPNTPVYVLSVGKTPSRFFSWRRVGRLNERLKTLVEAHGARWVDVTTPMLGPRGAPRRDLFVFDGIHPSPAGYAVWTSVLRPRFEAELAAPT